MFKKNVYAANSNLESVNITYFEEHLLSFEPKEIDFDIGIEHSSFLTLPKGPLKITLSPLLLLKSLLQILLMKQSPSQITFDSNC